MSTGSTFPEWEALLRARVSPSRYRHSVRASQLAAEIARAHGLPGDKAALAGLLHDFAREMPEDAMAPLARQAGLDPEIPDTWHGPVAAMILRRDHGLADRAVLSAIARHTVGDAAMTALDAAVYVADLAAHDIVPGLHDLALRDLHAATLAAMAATLTHLLQARRPIALRAIGAWNGILRRGML
jgi:predicted HD superfamily hydrolase involved in NAD metabolism